MIALPCFSERMPFLQPPAALCLVRMESNLNIKTPTWSHSSPLASNSRLMTSASFPGQSQTPQGSYISKHGVTPWRMCCYCIRICICVRVLLLLVVTSNASLDCTGAEMAFRVLYACTGDSAFVEFESTVIHYSEVLVNGRVLVQVHIAIYLCSVRLFCI